MGSLWIYSFHSYLHYNHYNVNSRDANQRERCCVSTDAGLMDWLDCLTSVSHLHSSRKNKQLNVNIRTRNIQVRMRESSVTWELSSADFDDLLHVRVFLRLSMSASCPPGSYLKNFTYFNVLRALSKV